MRTKCSCKPQAYILAVTLTAILLPTSLGAWTQVAGSRMFSLLGVTPHFSRTVTPNYPKSSGTHYIVVLGDSTYDITTINPNTITLNSTQLINEVHKGEESVLKDIDGDGQLDLLIPMSEEHLLFDSSTTEMGLTAARYDGVPISVIWYLCDTNEVTGEVMSIYAGRTQSDISAATSCTLGPFTKSISDRPAIGHLVQNGIASSCATPKPCPGTDTTIFNQTEDVFRRNTKPMAICVTVTTIAINCASGVHTTAVIGDSIIFGDLCPGYVGDSGQSTGTSGSTTFSFIVPPGDFYSLIFVEGTQGIQCSEFSYTIMESSCFDLCLQDDSSGNILRINSTTGEYQFARCGSGLVLSGIGSIIRKGSIITLQNYAADRRVLAKFDGGVNRGTASVQVFALETTFTITDRNTTNNTCACR